MAWRGLPVRKLDAAYLSQPTSRLDERDPRPVAAPLHAVHEVEHVALGLAREAMKEAFAEVNTTARPLVLMERAAHLGLVARASRCEAIVEKHGTKVSTRLELVEVNARLFAHGTPTRLELSWYYSIYNQFVVK
jgi:hypothetical protein